MDDIPNRMIRAMRVRRYRGLKVVWIYLGYALMNLVNGGVISLMDSHNDDYIPDDSQTETWTGRQLLARMKNCTPPAIEQFPRPLMSQSARMHGGLIVHLLVTVYMFIGLAIICDDYFVPALDRICESFNMSPDVAGATFMAAGSSAPELATSLIGVFVAQDDIGISGVIGSAVFNIMFVISICALFAGSVCYLNWWPMVRDCFFYMVSILALLGTIYDEKIEWYESIILLLFYVAYCVLMCFNTRLEAWAQTLPVPCKRPADGEDSALVSYKHLDDEEGQQPNPVMYTTEKPGDTNPQPDGVTPATVNETGPPQQPQGPPQQPQGQSQSKPPKPSIEPEDIFLVPEQLPKRVIWAILLPLVAMATYTVPDCRQERWRRWYVATFIMSLVWISLFSYIMVWMITIIGFTMGFPDTMMGLTFVAAGVSVPDALSSLAVVKEGYGDMAVSNAVGSNVFDILVCLGLPWFLRTVITQPGSTVSVISKGLVYSTFSLLSTVAFLLIATHMNGWKLDRKYGIILMLWYLIFMAFASMYELNIFGDFNPLECVSEF